MPQRPRNARNNKKTTASLRQSQPSTPRDTSPSPPLSPPTQLPTPLPEEHRSVTAHPPLPELMDPREQGASSGREDHGNTSVDTGRLIDFDAPTPPEPTPVLLPDADADTAVGARMGFGLLDVEEMDMEGTYRSPPFREARLPGGKTEVEENPPTLPVRPRVPYASASAAMAADLRGSGGDTDGRGGGEGRYAGHTRSPTFSRHARSPSASATSPPPPPLSPPYSSAAAHVAPSTHARSSISSPYTTSPPPPSSMSNSGSASAFENLTRTVRGYVPSPPGASRPVVSVESQASAHGQRRVGGQQQPEYEREYESQEGGGSYVYGYGYTQAQRSPQAQRLSARSPPAHQPHAQAQQHPPPTATCDTQPLPPPAYGYGYGYHQPQPLQPPQRYQALSQHPHQHQRSHSSTSPTTSASARSVSASGPGRSVPASTARRSVDLTSPTRRTSVTSLSSATGGMGGMGGVGSGLAQAMRRVGSRVTGGRSASGGGGGVGLGGGIGGTGGGGLGIGVGGGRRAAEAGGPRAEKERIVWARWDGMEDRRMLILAYPTGLQIWDCTNLSAINEVLNLNLNSDEWGMLLGAPDLNLSTASIRGGDGKPGVDEEGSSQALRIVHAALLPSPSRRSLGHAGRDAFGEDRPLLGILMDPSDEDERELEPRSTYVLYSLRRHQLVKRLTLPGLASSFTPNEHFIIISTTLPPTLHVLSSSTFHTLHTIASGSLEPFATPLFTGSSTALNLTNLNLASAQSTALSISNAITSTAQSTLSNKPKSVLLAGPGLSIDEDTATMNTNTNAQRQPTSANEPHPVYALSHRLLAYASPSPAASPSLQATLSKASRRLSSSSTATSNFMAHLLCAICGQDGDFGAEQPKVTCTSWNTTTTPCPNCVQVKTLDEHIEEARAYIRHLKAHRAALRRGGNTFHDPFTSLVPPEIASKILCFCIDGEEFKRRIPLVLSAVSKRWQIITHSTPLLWASIRLGAYPRSSRYSYEDMLRHWLKRSSQHPLSIDLQASSFTHYAREELENQYRPIIEILNAHCHRWRKLSVAMPLYLLGLLRGNFIGKPLLSHLEIRGDDLDDHDDEDSQTWKFDLGTALPAPHRVSISECRPQRIHINWCNVTDLFLACPRPQEIFALLKAAPLLRECRLQGLLPDVPEAASSYQDQDLPVVHHNLIKFTVEIWDVSLSPLFDGLCFPNLNSLFYSGSYASMTPHASFLVRSSCPIKSLTIHLSSDSDHSAELSDILWAVPTLERLDIEGVCVFDNFFQLLADDKGGFKRRRFLPSLMEISQAGSQSWAGMFTWKDISKAVEARASQHRAEGGLPVLKRFRWELHMLPEFDDRFYIDEGSVRVFEQLRADGIDIQLTNHYNKEGRRDMITYSRAYHQARHEREKKQSTSDG